MRRACTPCDTASFDVPALSTDSLDFRDVDIGYYHTCALGVDDAVYCWGRANGWGEVGDGSDSTRLSPVRVASSQTFTAITTGAYHSCALDSSGAAWCWGANGSGQIGAGLPPGTHALAPVRVAGNLTFTSLVAGYAQTCGTTADGAWCWGRNDGGQLGNGGREDSNVPVRVQD